MQGNARKRAQFSIFTGIVGKATGVRQALGGKKKARAKTGFVEHHYVNGAEKELGELLVFLAHGLKAL